MKKSAGLIVFRKKLNSIQFFLVHPGGPYWKNKDSGAWSMPKGEYADNDDPLKAALREFKEETGFEIATENFTRLNDVKLKSGKLISAWACEIDFEHTDFYSNEFLIEWPPRSGKQQSFPEVDKYAWFAYAEACEKINPALIPLLNEVIDLFS